MNNENYGNPTLGEAINFLFILLGSFCDEEGGLTAASQQNCIKEPKTEFSKYNFYDGESEISKLLNKFEETVFKEYKGYSQESFFLLYFPQLLISSIPILQHIYAYPKNQIIQNVVLFYFGYMIVYNREFIEKEQMTKRINDMLSETYRAIINSDTHFDIAELSENAKWGTVKSYLDSMKEIEVKDEEKSIFCAKIIRHYLYLNFKKALKKIFNIEDTLRFSEDDLMKISDVVEVRIKTVNNPIEVNTPEWIWKILYSEEISKNIDKRDKIIDYCEKPIYRSLNMLSKISYDRFQYILYVYSSFSDEPIANFMKNWFMARNLIFSLKFDDSDDDKTIYKQATDLFKETFDEYKYVAGNSLIEFLADAIAADVYFNKKNIKDIVDNTQDNTGESSILKPGKTYWEFGYAIGLFPENSEKTYLAAYNAEKNFWGSFKISKFINRESALKRFESDMEDEELNILNLVKNADISTLLSEKRKDTRQKLKSGKRLYNNLSFAIMKAETMGDFKAIEKYIDNIPVEKLVKNDENGATPLIRALFEYKNLVYGYSKEYRKERAKIIYEYQKETDTVLKYVDGELSDSDVDDKKLSGVLGKKQMDTMAKMLNFFSDNLNRYCKTLDEKKIKELKDTAKKIKTHIIIPLIKKIGSTDKANSLLDEAIELDINNGVSALQLAIDSYDAELVSLLIENLPKEKKKEKKNLAKIYISEKYTTPLQYAIRKYDLLMQSYDRFIKQDLTTSLEFQEEIPNRRPLAGGIVNEDKSMLDSYQENKYFPIKIMWFEECGFALKTYQPEKCHDNIVLYQQEKLRNIIINVLAEKTNPISVDNFYYLVAQSQNEYAMYGDLEKLAKDLIATGKAQLDGVNSEYYQNIYPERTLLAECIRLRSYGFLRMFLSEYPEKFKNIINQKVIGTGANPHDFRVETDVHMFVLNQIESTKAWLDPSYTAEKVRRGESSQEESDNVSEILQSEEGRKEYGESIAWKLSTFLPLFKKAGADFTIKDQAGRSVKDLLLEWKDKFPEGSIPEGILD